MERRYRVKKAMPENGWAVDSIVTRDEGAAKTLVDNGTLELVEDGENTDNLGARHPTRTLPGNEDR